MTDTPSYNNYGSFLYQNVDDLKVAFTEADEAYQGVLSFVNYVEGIYVGYKFYETAAEEGLITYEDKVQYPFGYGLSYTTFLQEIKNFTDRGDRVAFDVEVTNTGNTAGKDVAEVYVTPPYTNGGIEKASVNLINFGKTGILEPGASEILSYEIAKEDMASYDSGKIKTADGGSFLSGKNEWQSRDIPRQTSGGGDHLGLNPSLPATCFPTAATVANRAVSSATRTM